jgi:hypothetical protein
LLRTSGTGAESTSGCNKDGCGALRFRHLTDEIEGSGRGARANPAHSPYHAPCVKTDAIPVLPAKGGFCCRALNEMINGQTVGKALDCTRIVLKMPERRCNEAAAIETESPCPILQDQVVNR